MEQKTINGVDCAIKYYSIRDIKFWIGAAIDSDVPNYIRFKSRRHSKEKISLLENIIEKNEFFTDVDFLVDFFESLEYIDDNTIAKAYLEICAKHITDKQRIIDTDLYLYADETLLVVQNIYLDVFGIKITDAMCESAFSELVEHAVNFFEKYIYLTKYEVDGMKPYLVKLTEL